MAQGKQNNKKARKDDDSRPVFRQAILLPGCQKIAQHCYFYPGFKNVNL
jgi:hypothetical protein